MKLTDKQFNQAVQKEIDSPATQKKLLELVTKLNELKENDVQAFAMAALLLEVVKGLPGLKEVKVERK